MATPAEGCLAVAVQIYSDNSDEVTGTTLTGGATGGIWTGAGELLGVRAIPTADLPCSSPRCRSPAQSGRSLNQNPTTLVKSVSLAFGSLVFLGAVATNCE